MIESKWFNGNEATIAELVNATGCKSVAELGRKIGIPHRQNIDILLKGNRRFTEILIQKIEKIVIDPKYNFREVLDNERKKTEEV